MASFFGMGRAPHQLSLRVTYEGYAKNPEDPDAPIPREGTLAVDWEAAEESSAVLERIDAQMRTLPFNHKGQVVALRLDVDDRAGSASNASASPNGGSAGNGANGVGAHQRTSSGNLLKDVFGAGGLTSFLLGGGDDDEASSADPKRPPKLPPSEGKGSGVLDGNAAPCAPSWSSRSAAPGPCASRFERPTLPARRCRGRLSRRWRGSI